MSFLSARILYFSICGATYLQIEKKRSFIEVSAIYIYIHEIDFLQKTQGFGYELDFRILYLRYKKSKTQKTEGKLKFFS